MKIHLREGRVVPLAQARLIAFPEFLKLMGNEGLSAKRVRRIWNILSFELLRLGGALQVGDDERKIEVSALKGFLDPRRRLKHLTGIGEKSEQALRSLSRRL